MAELSPFKIGILLATCWTTP